MRRLGTIAAAVALLAAGVGPAFAADDGQNVPPAASPKAWAKYVQDLAEQNAVQDWSTARGVLIADSGFRPFANGFSFFNYGVPDVMNARVYGTSRKGAKNLDAETVRDLMGKKVCIGGNSTGDCRLTLAGKNWRDAQNNGMSDGHCFGMAAVATQFYNGSLAPSTYQPGAGAPYDLQLRTPISREIAKYFVTQFTSEAFSYEVSARQLVKQLREGLTPANPGYVLGIWGEGGHAVTPYALYDAGGGQYDIAVYDNNYPDVQRVVRVDTVKNTVRYAFAVNPNQPDSDSKLWSQVLIPIDVLTGKQPCPFCIDAKTTQITFGDVYVKKANPARIRVTRLDGQPLKQLKVIPPADTQSLPSFVLPKDKAFRVHYKNRTRSALPLSMNAITGAYQLGVASATVPAGKAATIAVDAQGGALLYRGKQLVRQDPNLLSFLDNGQRRIVEVDARAGSKTAKTVGGGMDRRQKLVTVFPIDRKPGRASALAALEYYENGRARTLRTKVSTDVPADGALVLDYSKWSKNRPRALRAYLVVGSSVESVTVARPRKPKN